MRLKTRGWAGGDKQGPAAWAGAGAGGGQEKEGRGGIAEPVVLEAHTEGGMSEGVP